MCWLFPCQCHAVYLGQLIPVMIEAHDIVAFPEMYCHLHLAPFPVGVSEDGLSGSLVDIDEEVLAFCARISPAYLALGSGL